MIFLFWPTVQCRFLISQWKCEGWGLRAVPFGSAAFLDANISPPYLELDALRAPWTLLKGAAAAADPTQTCVETCERRTFFEAPTKSGIYKH